MLRWYWNINKTIRTFSDWSRRVQVPDFWNWRVPVDCHMSSPHGVNAQIETDIFFFITSNCHVSQRCYLNVRARGLVQRDDRHGFVVGSERREKRWEKGSLNRRIGTISHVRVSVTLVSVPTKTDKSWGSANNSTASPTGLLITIKQPNEKVSINH